MSDRQVLLLAIAVALGALVAYPVPSWVVAIAAVVLAVALSTRRPAGVIAAAALVASALAAHSLDGLRPPSPAVISGQWVTLLTDPAPYDGGSVGADVRLGRRHVQAFARGPAATLMASHLAGEKLRVDGTLSPLEGVTRRRLLPRHIAARLSVDTVSGARPASMIGRAANGYRRVVARGAERLPERLRPLFGGMVLGDDRGQSPELQAAFRAAGLTHLLVVSGQNVAFALLVASPLLARGRLWWRFGSTLAVLFAFGVLTRWEPSVLRAEAMAAVAAAGTLVGRPVPAVRLLALAVTGCVLLDPLLVRSVGFRLSVAACAGLVVVTPSLRRRGLPALVAASLAAQAGAAVVLLPTFGSVPLVSLAANVLAVPVAGPLMMWGLTAGPIAGLIPELAGIIHAPTRAALAWEAGVATRAASLPLAPLGLAGAGTLAAAAFALLAARYWPSGARRTVCAGALATALLVGGLALRGPSNASGVEVAPGVSLWVIEGRSVVAVTGRTSARLLDELRARRVHRLDVLVVARPGTGAANAAWPLISAFRPRVVLAPEHHQVAGARTARKGAVVVVGAVEVRITDAGPPLRFHVGRVVAAAGWANYRPASPAQRPNPLGRS